ncbi:MAG: hypothetical protein IKE15_11390 [Clostridia bacterium]|nr:hypothetical protein [Clostridia bacterium]
MIVEQIIKDGAETITVWDGIEWKDKSIDEETKAFLQAYIEKYPKEKAPEYVDLYGELFAIRYVSQLTKTASRIDIRKVLDPVEGKDFICFDILGRNGNAEIKTIKPFLTQNNNPQRSPDPCGSIPFEIFHRWIPDRYEDMYAGWLLSAYNSTKYNEIKRSHNRDERAEIPGLYIYVLVGSNGKPYACIAFEDIYALLTGLDDICPDSQRWGIPDPETLTPATDREYWDQFAAWNHYDKRSGGMVQNCWYAPLQSISDLATVTMINDVDPEEELKKASYKCLPDVAKKRYDFLQQIADRDGRKKHFDPDGWTRKENKWIEELETDGAKVSKRNYISLSASELEKLEKGISVTKNGKIIENS